MGRLRRHCRALLAGLLLAASLPLGAPAWAGPPFITDDPEPVDLGHWEVYAFSDGAIDRNDASGLGPAIEVNYGAAPNLQLHVIADLAYDNPFGSPSRMGAGGGGYWINPGPGNRNYWFAGWLLQRQVTDKLALGGEVFHQTSNMVGRSDSTGFSLGGVYDITKHCHLLFSGGRGGLLYAVDGARVTDPITYYLAFQWTF